MRLGHMTVSHTQVEDEKNCEHVVVVVIVFVFVYVKCAQVTIVRIRQT